MTQWEVLLQRGHKPGPARRAPNRAWVCVQAGIDTLLCTLLVCWAADVDRGCRALCLVLISMTGDQAPDTPALGKAG